MRFDSPRLDALPYRTRPSVPAVRRVWVALVWPGVRMMLKVIAVPLALFVGLPTGLLTLASIERAARLAYSGDAMQAARMAGVAWLCGSVAALAFWPRRL